MAQFTSTRPVDTPPRLVGREPINYAQELQEFLERLVAKVMGGIPSGFNATTPQPVSAGIASSAGTEAASWAAADHVHNLPTASAVALSPSSVNAEGSSTAAARSDHTHNMTAISAAISTLADDAMFYAAFRGGA